MTKAIELIAAERQRGIEKEGYDADHDDEHVAGHIAQGGIAYATAFIQQHQHKRPDLDFVREMHWPFDARTWKPGDRVSNLVKAGAMIAAELDRELRELEGRPASYL